MKRNRITSNPAQLAKTPKVDDEEVEPYTVDEIQRILLTAQQRRNAARWAIALALGLRQGEVLGLKWADIDLDAGTLIVRRSRLRPRWKHGCATPRGHKHDGHCPHRVAMRTETGSTKSKAGKRGTVLPDELVKLLKQHAQEQPGNRSPPVSCGRKADTCSPRRPDR